MSEISIRIAAPEDAPALLDIYAYYVRHTAITFEYEVPTPEEFAARIRNTLKKYPYLVAVKDGVMVGYAYAGPFHSRPAYGWTAETSIYLRRDFQGNGLGQRFYHALEELSRAQGVRTLVACVTYSQAESPYVTDASVRFHSRLGYDLAGRLKRCGLKFGQWFGTCYFEKALGDYPETPAPLIPFPDLP